MKRLLLLLAIVATLLAGCGLSDAAQDTAASMSASNGQGVDSIEIAVDSVKCDVHPRVNSNKAQAMCRLEIDNDSLKLGSDGPIELFLGGTLEVPDNQFVFENAKSFSSSGSGNLRACQLNEWVSGLFYPCGLPFLALTAQIDGIHIPVEINGVASNEGAKEFSEFSTDKNGESFLIDFKCTTGQLIPNSSLANIIMIGELKDGRQISGGGIVDTASPVFTAKNGGSFLDGCDATARGVVFEVEVTLITWGSDVATILITDKESGEVSGIVVNHEEQW